MEIALITGGNRGLGFETAKQLLQLGYHVIITARNREAGIKAVADLKTAAEHVEWMSLDLTNEDAQKELVYKIKEKYGKLDVLVNNAGAYFELDGGWQGNTATVVSQATLKQTFDVNFFSVIGLTQKLLPLIEKSDQGRIVNVSSIMGSCGIHADLDGGMAEVKPLAYDASKTALNAFTIHLAKAMQSKGISVNSVHPGWVATEMGTEHAPMTIPEGAKTLVDMANDKTGRTGKFIHLGEELPW
jgi:NAD(P)-dependent dehydrogenase (short-subunit alcohol dehydrogenase family)